MFRKLFLPLALLLLAAPAARAAPMYDVMVLVDGSGSVSAPDFVTQVQSVQHLFDGFAIGPADNRFGIVQFGTAVSMSAGLSGNSAHLSNALANMSQAFGQTNHADAFTLAATEFAANARALAQQVVILLTDGIANVHAGGGSPLAAAIDAANDLKSAGALVFAVGFGPLVSFGDMADYASAPAGDYAYNVASFAEGNGVMAAITAQLNPVQDPEIAVPAPATLALAGFGLVALALSRRRCGRRPSA